MLRQLATRFRQQDWVLLGSELIIVAASIFVAFQVDRWWDDRADLIREQQYIVRLIADIESDIDAINYSIGLARMRQRFAELLIDVADNPELANERPVEFMAAIHQSAYTSTSALNTDTFEEMISTGKLGLLTDDRLKSALFEYYRFDEWQRQYLLLQLMTEFKHFELCVGVLTNKQVVWIQDNVGLVKLGEFVALSELNSKAGSVASAANRLIDNLDCVAWLPESRGLQLELISTHEGRRERAQTVLTLLKNADTNPASSR